MPPKKKYVARLPHFTSSDEAPGDQNQVDESPTLIEIVSTEEKQVLDKTAIITSLYITPAGYPIKPFDAPDSLNVKIGDPKLFQAYASEQWVGLSVKKFDYIFDQLIIPDFAFKVVNIKPEGAYSIGADTKFILKQKPIQRPQFDPIKFDQIIGNLQAKSKAKVIIKYLQEPTQFGEWAPKNILFYGPPGTGKTLTARAIATAADCTFLARKGTTLIGLHVGDGANKIHQLFKEAKKNAPAIIFVDELDSIGLNRSFQNVRGDVVEVATALLAELDGLEVNTGVITIGATNGIELIDPGLRSRFEEEINFILPNEKERLEMLELFSKKVPVALNVNFSLVAKNTEGWSGRALHEKLMKIAVHKAVQEELKIIDTGLLLSIVNTVNMQDKDYRAPSDLFS